MVEQPTPAVFAWPTQLPRLLSVFGLVIVIGACQNTRSPIADQAAESSTFIEQTYISEALDTRAKYYLYLPSEYSADQVARFPVVYWLHGSNGVVESLFQRIAARFDGAIAAGRIPPLIVVFPDGQGQSMWVDASSGNAAVESMLVDDLIPHIDANYRTVASAQGRLLEGGSMGGYGAARLGLKYSDRFTAVSMLNAGPLQPRLDPNAAPIVGRQNAQAVLDRVFAGNGDAFYAASPWRLAERHARSLPETFQIRQWVGAEDPTRANNAAFAEHLKELGIRSSFYVLPGVTHSPQSLFAALGNDYWAFFDSVFGSANSP